MDFNKLLQVCLAFKTLAEREEDLPETVPEFPRTAPIPKELRETKKPQKVHTTNVQIPQLPELPKFEEHHTKRKSPHIVLDLEGKFHLDNNMHLVNEYGDFIYPESEIVDAILEAEKSN